MTKAFQRVWEQISIYLPVLLMAFLALGTWWLVRNAPKPLVGNGEAVVSSEPDYTLHQFSVRQYDRAGQFQSVITGDEARHLPQSDVLEVDQVRTRTIAPNGAVTTTEAQRGISNSDGSEVQLWGDAKVVRTNPQDPQASATEVEGDFLHAWTDQERVQSHLPVVLTRGNDRFTGDAMEYDNIDQVIELKGRVKGVIFPGK